MALTAQGWLCTEVLDGGAEQRAVMARLAAAQQVIGTEVGRIGESLTAQNSLSRQRQATDGALDLRTRRYLRDMGARARDLLRWSVYHLVMAYRYEFLTDVSDGFFNFDKTTAALRNLAAVTATGIGPDKPPTSKMEDFRKIENTVLLNELLAETKQILERRQHRALAARRNTVQQQVRRAAPRQQSRRTRFDPHTPTVVQTGSWQCSAAATAWVLRSLGYPHSQDEVVALLGPGHINPDLGLLGGDGRGLVALLRGVGLAAANAPVSFDDVLAMAGRRPVALQPARELGDRLEIARCLEGLGRITTRFRPTVAAQVAGAAAELRSRIGAEPYPRERADLAAWV